jgi:hypothetical protein
MSDENVTSRLLTIKSPQASESKANGDSGTTTGKSNGSGQANGVGNGKVNGGSGNDEVIRTLTPQQAQDALHDAPTKVEYDWRRWHQAGFGTELLPIIPPNAKLAETSKIKPAMLGKVPGLRKNDGTWIGYTERWAENVWPKASRLKEWQSWGAGIGMQ